MTGAADDEHGAPPARARGSIQWDRFRALWEQQPRARRDIPRPALLMTVAVALWVVALVAVFLTWNGAAERRTVAEQIPYIVSGSVTAFLLTLIGIGLFVVAGLQSPTPPPRVRDVRGEDDGSDEDAVIRPIRRARSR